MSKILARVLFGIGATLRAVTATPAAEVKAAEVKAPAGKPTAQKYVVPKPEFGQPELRGVWNYSSDTPLERPREFKDREFLTAEEVAARSKAARERMAASDGASIAGVGGYNIFWMD